MTDATHKPTLPNRIDAFDMITIGTRRVMSLYPGCRHASLVVDIGDRKPPVVIPIFPQAERPTEPAPPPAAAVALATPARRKARGC